MQCRQCGTTHYEGDNFCRQCGESLNVTRLPARATSTQLDRVRSNVKLLAWRGVATMAVTTLAQMMVREAIRQVTPAPIRGLRRRDGNQAPVRPPRQAPAAWGGYPPAEIQEAVVVRRIRFRR